jgi:hypothetical protein
MLEQADGRGVVFVFQGDGHRSDELTKRIPELRAVPDVTAVELVEIDDMLT